MARIIVTPTDDSGVVLMDEEVHPVHMGDEYTSLQIIERLAWAVGEAETVEEAAARRPRLSAA
jgi:hypothetical protein